MVKVVRNSIVAEALRMLDEVGLNGLSTRGLAQRLHVEQPALYWHFKSKEDLLDEMAFVAMRPHARERLPGGADNWQVWFLNNARSLRETLLIHRDGARLHTMGRPREEDAHRIEHKIDFLVASGFREQDATMALLGAGRFVLGCVLEEQSETGSTPDPTSLQGTKRPIPDHLSAFETGLELLVQGLACRKAPREN